MKEKPHVYTDREIKLTAAIYATIRGVVAHIREHGRMPETFGHGGLWIAMKSIIRERGTDLVLTEDEQLVYDAIIRERRLPAGGVILLDDESLKESGEKI